MDVGNPEHRIRELGMAAPPVMHDLGPTHAQSSCDLRCINQVVQIDLSSHLANGSDGL